MRHLSGQAAMAGSEWLDISLIAQIIQHVTCTDATVLR